jgi:hypothetical protein
MRDAYALLHQKEADCERVRREIESLLLVIPLLSDDEPPRRLLEGKKKE